RHVVRGLADKLLRAEDHVRNRIRLTLLAIENRPNNELRRIDPGGDDRPKRTKAVEAFGASPLRKGGISADDIGGGDIVDAGITKNIIIGLIDRYPAAFAPDDYSEFALVSDFTIIGSRSFHDCIRRGRCGRRLRKVERIVGL